MRFSPKDMSLLFCFPVIMAVGQILFRQATAGHSDKNAVQLMQTMLATPSFYAALAFYAFATVWWVWLLSRYPLSVAYPIAITAVVFTPLIDRLVYRATFHWTYWLGLALIAGGVVIIVRSKVDAAP